MVRIRMSFCALTISMLHCARIVLLSIPMLYLDILLWLFVILVFVVSCYLSCDNEAFYINFGKFRFCAMK